MKLMKFTPIVLFFCITYSLQAQTLLGGKLGVHLGKWKTEQILQDEELNSNAALQAGFISEFGITNRLSIHTGLYYIQKGVRGTSQDFSTSIELQSKIILNYLELPLLLKVQINSSEEGPIFYGLAGPSIAYALSGKLISEGLINGEKFKETEDLEFSDDDGFKRAELSLAIGAGVNIPSGPGKVLIDLRYLLGLSNLNDEGDGASVKNRGAGLTIGYLFPIGK